MRKDTTLQGVHATRCGKQGTNGVGAGGGVVLGTTAKSSSNGRQAAIQQRKHERWSLLHMAKKQLPEFRVALCMHALQPGHSVVEVLYVPATQTAHYRGLVTCGSVWVCPICAPKITEKRRGELSQVLHKAREMGLRVVMVTYTFSHHRGNVLSSMVHSMRQAMKYYKSGGAVKVFKEHYKVVGTVRALEVTYSHKNGWHPHIHELVFLQGDADVDGFAVEARRRWEHAAKLCGLSMNEHGFQVDDCDERVADYIAKFGHEPAWDESAELTKWHMKQGGTGLAVDEHVTPFQLLAYAHQGDEQAGNLFREYAFAFKGARQLVWSQHLRDLFALGQEQTDEEIADEHEQEAEMVVGIPAEEWRKVLANACRAELLLAANAGKLEPVLDLLAAIGVMHVVLPNGEVLHMRGVYADG